MLLRLSIAASLFLALAIPQQVCASPITFDFTGTGGVSGSFTINGDPTVPPGSSFSGSPPNTALLTEGGSDVSLTVNFGGQKLNFSNSLADPAEAQAYVTYGPGAGNTSYAMLGIQGLAANLGGLAYEFNVELLVPTDEASLSNLRTFGEAVFSTAEPWASRWIYTPDPPLPTGGSGTLTSVQIVSTPEPSSIVIFSAIAVAAMIQARRGRRGQFARP